MQLPPNAKKTGSELADPLSDKGNPKSQKSKGKGEEPNSAHWKGDSLNSNQLELLEDTIKPKPKSSNANILESSVILPKVKRGKSKLEMPCANKKLPQWTKSKASKNEPKLLLPKRNIRRSRQKQLRTNATDAMCAKSMTSGISPS